MSLKVEGKPSEKELADAAAEAAKTEWGFETSVEQLPDGHYRITLDGSGNSTTSGSSASSSGTPEAPAN